MFRKRLKILVLVPHGLGFARAVVLGVRKHAVQTGEWAVIDGELPAPGGIPRADGIICLCGDSVLELALRSLNVPVINVSARLPESVLPRVLVDNQQVGRLAAEHLIDRGFRRFGFLPQSGLFYSEERGRGFLAALEAHGLADAAVRLETPEQAARSIRQTPIGILAAHDSLGLRLIEECINAGLAVPEQVAVVGADNDDFVCGCGPVGLSSVDTCGQQIGYAAAGVLAKALSGHAPGPAPLILPCGPVISRQSTDCLACEDSAVAIAAAYIRDYACKPLGIAEIVSRLHISRRTLEKRFRRAFGRSLHDEIRRQQILRAQQLLTGTDLPIKEIFGKAGFCDRIAFTRAFRASTGKSPSEYRVAAGAHHERGQTPRPAGSPRRGNLARRPRQER
jgi:LacI family transcriptional regulator